MKQRDSFRGKFYLSEQSLRLTGIRFRSIEEIQIYVDDLLGTRWWQNRFPTADEVLVREGRSALYAYSDWDEVDRIVHPRWSWKEIYVVHELSHVASRHLEGLAEDDPGVWADHGREFIRIYLDIVSYKLGREASRDLKESFDAFGIAWRKRDLTRLRLAPKVSPNQGGNNVKGITRRRDGTAAQG